MVKQNTLIACLKFWIVRPGSIETCNTFRSRKIRSSMGDCHSFDPGSNPGPGVLALILGAISYTPTKIEAKWEKSLSSLTATNEILSLLVRVESSSKPSVPYSFPPASFTTR